MANNNEQQLTAEALAAFSEGITLTLLRWDALRMAVENEWGGPNSRQIADQLHSDILNWFTTPSKDPRYADDLEDMLYDSLLTLNTVAEDGSDVEVAVDLMNMYEDLLAGNYCTIERLRETRNFRRPSVTQVLNDDDEDEEDGYMQVDDSSNVAMDVPRPQPNSNSASMPAERSNGVTEPEDGWVVVSSRRRRN